MMLCRRNHRITAMVLSALTVAAFSGCSGSPQAVSAAGVADSGSPAIAVQVSYAQTGELVRENQFAGRIEATQNIKVYPEVSGTVSRVYCSVGDTVQKGQLLFELDAADAATELQQAGLAYQKTLAGLDSEESGSANALTELSYQKAIETARQSYERARENLDLASDDDFDMSEFRKVRKRWKDASKAYDKDQNEGTWDELMDAEDDYYELLDDYTDYQSYVTAFENAYTSYEEALEQYEIYQSMTTGEDASTREISRGQAELTYQTAQKYYDDHRVYAPASGVISARNIDPFDIASTQTNAFTIAGEGLPSVSFSLSETGAQALNVQDSVAVIYQGDEYEAVVTEISPEADSTGLYPAKAQLTEEIGAGRSGAVVKVRVTTAREEDALILPLDLVNYDGNQPYVYLCEDGVARRVDLTLGITTTDSVSVTGGLSPDDAVITTWSPSLKDGAAVRQEASKAPGKEG